MASLGFLDTEGNIFHLDDIVTSKKKKKNEEVPPLSAVSQTVQPLKVEPTVQVQPKEKSSEENKKNNEYKKIFDDRAKKQINYQTKKEDIKQQLEIPTNTKKTNTKDISIGKTLGNVATNMGTGALKALEGVADAASDLIFNPYEKRLNYAYDYITKGKKIANENLKDLEKMQQRDIKKNMTKSFQDKVGYSDVKKDWEKGSLVNEENFGGQLAQGVGGMVPALVTGSALGAAPELANTSNLAGKEKLMATLGNVAKTYVSQAPANVMLGASSYGGGVEEALNEGATIDKARKYGLANAAIEQGTEMLTGGIPGLEGKGGIDNFIEPVINKNTNGYLNALLKTGYGALGEGLEESSGTYLNALAKKGILGKNINWDEVNQEALQSGLLGAATGAFLNSPQTMQDIKNVNTENKIRNAIGDAEYAEGNQQYNPEYKGWEKQREENKITREEEKKASEERKQEIKRVEEEKKIKNEEDYNNKVKQTILNGAEKAATYPNQTKERFLKNWYNKDSERELGITKKQLEEIYDKANEKQMIQNETQENIDKNKMTNTRNLSDIRDWDEVGKRNVKAYQYENPEVKPYFQEVAKNMLEDLSNATRGEKYMTQEEEWKGVKRDIADDLASLLDGENGQKYSYKDLEKGLNAIIKDEGSENNAISKRIEFYIDQRLRNGYRDYLGEKISPNQDYIKALSNKQINNQQQNVNLAEESKEPVLKIETPQQEKQHYIDNGMSEETAKILTEMPKTEKQPLKERIKEGKAKLSEEWSYLKRNLVDKGETIYNLGKKTKNPNLYAKYDKRGTTTGEANYDIGVAQTNLKGKKFENFTDANGNKKSMSLNEIWEGIDPKVANEYLAHYLNVDRYSQLNQDGTNKYVFGESITDKDSLKKVKQLEKEYPELKRFGENVWQYGKNQLQNMVDAGKISQAQADSFLKETPHYVRLQRNVEKTSSPLLEFDKNGNVKVNKNIKEFKGSTLDILPFKETMAQYTLDVRNSIRDNLFAQELAKTLGIDGNGNEVANIDDLVGTNPELLKDNGDGTYSLTFFNKGVATTIPINEGIYESLQPNKHYKFEDTLAFKGIRKIDNVRKALLTDKNPMFLATNMIKDAFDAPLNSKYPVLFAKNYPRAFYEIIKGGKNYQQYQALGGMQNTYFDNQQFTKQGSKLNPLTWIEKANNAIEQIPRLAEFMSTMEKTGDIDQAMYNAAEVTTNFKRGGNITKAANRNGASFLNASVQGFNKQIRNFTDIQNPKQAVQMLGKILVLGIAPGLLNDLMWDDDDEYKEMQDYQKDRYYLFKGKNGNWIRIPKGRAISVFQSAARKTKYAMKGEEGAFKDFGSFASSQVAPNNPFENNIISPFVDVAKNESWSGNKIIPTAYEKKKAEKQYNEKTDKISRKISEEINKSELVKKTIPKNFRSAMGINYLINQYSGAIGDMTLPYITPKVSTKNTNPISAPFLDKFTTDSVYSNKSVNNFYDTMNRLAEEDETPVDAAKNSYMTSKSIALSQLYKEQRNIQNDETLSKDEKYNKAREIQKEINKFTKDTVKNINNIDQEEYYIKIGDDYYKRVIKNGEEKYVKDSSKKIPTESKYALYDYFKEKYEKSKEEKK